MGITSAIVLYAVTWFMVSFVVLPIGLSTQGDEGEVVPGTHESSPARYPFKRKLIQTTIWGTVVWAVLTGIILSDVIGVRDIDWFDRMSPREVPAADGTGG